MKKIVAALVILGSLAATPANAWYRGVGGWRGPVYNNYNYYGGGYGRGYYGGGYGAAMGAAAGAALLGGVIGGAIASQPYGYGYGYPAYGGYCRRPLFDAWGNFMGYSGC